MRRLSGFSLMEMMTVLLIVSVVAAASAPMINKRMMVNQAAGGCVWTTLVDGSIYYNQGAIDRSVIIGADRTNNNLSPKLHIRTTDEDPFITFQREGVNNQLALRYGENTVSLSTNVNELADGGTAIGANASAGANGVAVGGTAAAGSNSVAIGNVSAEANNAVTIGNNINVTSNNQQSDIIAIGRNIQTNKAGTIAIGKNIMTHANQESNNSIILSSLNNNYSIQTWLNAIAISTGISNSRNIPDDEKTGTKNVNLGSYSISIGFDALGSGTTATAVGAHTTATAERATAIGRCAEATGTNSTAIGNGATATKNCSLAIGNGYVGKDYGDKDIFIHAPKAEHENSVAIGRGARTTTENQIVLGTGGGKVDKIDLHKTTVYIPGDLVVGGDVHLGLNETSNVFFRTHDNRNLTSKGRYILGAYHDDHGYTVRASYKYTYDAPSVEKIYSGFSLSDWKSSDRRLKNVGKAFTSGLAEIKKLEVFNYTFKKDESKTPRVGVMAQDLQKIFPNAVTKGEDGFLRIRMEDMFYAVVNAVKELASMFDRQDERIAQLEKENKELHKTINDLEKRLEKLEKQK